MRPEICAYDFLSLTSLDLILSFLYEDYEKKIQQQKRNLRFTYFKQ